MKAYIIRDVLDDECVLRELTDSLSKEDIGYFCFNDLLDLEKLINQDNPDEPVIFYPNIFKINILIIYYFSKQYNSF